MPWSGRQGCRRPFRLADDGRTRSRSVRRWPDGRAPGHDNRTTQSPHDAAACSIHWRRSRPGNGMSRPGHCFEPSDVFVQAKAARVRPDHLEAAVAAQHEESVTGTTRLLRHRHQHPLSSAPCHGNWGLCRFVIGSRRSLPKALTVILTPGRPDGACTRCDRPSPPPVPPAPGRNPLHDGRHAEVRFDVQGKDLIEDLVRWKAVQSFWFGLNSADGGLSIVFWGITSRSCSAIRARS